MKSSTSPINWAVTIRPIGKFFPLDNEGFVINESAIEKIPNHWIPVIEAVKNSYLKHLKNRVHSIYLRGSLPRGLNVDGFSDLDTFALITGENIRWQKADWKENLQYQLQNEFPFVKEIEVRLSSFHTDFFEKNPRLSMILQTQSLCIWGKDIIPSLPKFKPGRDMMLNINWIETDVKDFLKKERISKAACQEMMKVILRTGFELVMPREQQYTTDLYFCWSTFSKYYPEKKEEMKKALLYYLNPATDKESIQSFIKSFGNYLIQQVSDNV